MTVASARTESLAALSARLRSASNLPSPPAVAARLIDVADDPDLSMTKVVEILRIDPALTAKLLRLANSPLYARRRHIETLQQAVTLLGLDTVMTAALSLTLLSDTTAQSADVFRRQWSRSVYAAVSAQALAAHCPHVPAPDAFLAALLQDVGILALARLEPTLYADLVDTDHDALTAREHSVLGVDHAEAGAELLACWNLPSHVVGAVRQSHAATCERSDALENIVSLSGRIADVIEDRRDMADIAAQARARGFTEDQLNAALEAISVALPPLTALLNADAPPEGRLAEMAAEMIMERMMSAQAATEQLRDRAADAAETADRLAEEHRNDSLTGQLTRRSFEAALDEHVEQWNRYGWPLAVLFIDIDHFKHVNDTYGHGVGDEVLTHVAATLARQLRQGDLIGRYGGDEFVIALPAVNVTTVRSVAARLVAAVRSHPVTTPNGDLHHQTISIGIATTDQHPAPVTRQALLESADRALYAAKRAGRNQWSAA